MAAVRRRLPALLLALTLGACAPQFQVRQQDMAASFSDGRFQVEWETAQTKKGSPLIAGYVKNARGSGVANIRLRIDTLDAEGQGIGTTTALAPGYVGGFSRTYFEVPLEKTGIGYRDPGVRSHIPTFLRGVALLSKRARSLMSECET